MNSKNFGSTGAKNTYDYIRRGRYNNAAYTWLTTGPKNMNQYTLNAKLLRNSNARIAREKFKIAQNKLNKNMSKYYNKKLAAELLKIERRIQSNRRNKGGIAENTKKTLSNLVRRQNNTKSRLLNKLALAISGSKATVPISNIIGSNYSNKTYMTNTSGGLSQRSRTTRRTSPIKSTMF
jgi:hypothetical protein